jgi:hypothetical protein
MSSKAKDKHHEDEHAADEPKLSPQTLAEIEAGRAATAARVKQADDAKKAAAKAEKAEPEPEEEPVMIETRAGKSKSEPKHEPKGKHKDEESKFAHELLDD